MPDDAQNALLLEGTAPMIECLCRLRKAGYVVGASIAGFGDDRGLVDEFQYRLEEMDALEQETNCMPVNVTGMAWGSTSKPYTSTSLQNAIMTTIGVVSSGNWHIEAKRTLNSIVRLSEAFHDKAAKLDKMKKANPKAKLIQEKQASRKAGRELRLARTSFTDQIEAQAKASCRPFCEAVHERLPQELRDIIARHLLTETSVTFLSSKDGKISIVNGLSTLRHAFEEEYTGIGLHMDIISELLKQDARFDFRARHELLGKVFKHYAADERGGLDLACKMRRLSLVVTEHHLEDREIVLARLEELCRLSKGAKIFIIIETGHGTKAQTVRQVRRVLRAFFELLQRLHNLSLHIHIVVDPAYFASRVKNDSDDTFSVVHEGPWRYVMTPKNATFTVKGFEERLKHLFGTYGEHWSSRIPLQVG
ncbi:hypothetical protein J4E93_009784 [Alternaria ventricosa]|uniref:uncharacterized protein n=1 Tax=Alternaria ventricosa TaxID=1187951 RepID=UPI0020C54D0A|nr:uncharacterized protein J4E93_009784 [Alternaria ventricosa]KAI4638756.1 hypothetical protein J4E93_009784 [Alternaria ventricosa]